MTSDVQRLDDPVRRRRRMDEPRRRLGENRERRREEQRSPRSEPVPRGDALRELRVEKLVPEDGRAHVRARLEPVVGERDDVDPGEHEPRARKSPRVGDERGQGPPRGLPRRALAEVRSRRLAVSDRRRRVLLGLGRATGAAGDEARDRPAFTLSGAVADEAAHLRAGRPSPTAPASRRAADGRRAVSRDPNMHDATAGQLELERSLLRAEPATRDRGRACPRGGRCRAWARGRSFPCLPSSRRRSGRGRRARAAVARRGGRASIPAPRRP